MVRSNETINYHNAWSSKYDEIYQNRAGLYHAVTMARLKNYLRNFDVSQALDLGGGTGIWTEVLVNMGIEPVTLVDNSVGMIEVAKEKLKNEVKNGSVEIIEGDATSLIDFDSDSFSLVLALGDVLSYCGDAEKAMSEIFRASKKGGVFIASVESRLGRADELIQRGDFVNASSCLKKGVARIGNPSWSKPFVGRFYSCEELRRLITESGFEVISIVGKSLTGAAISIDDIKLDKYKWLIEFDMKYGSDKDYINAAKYIEVFAHKP